MPTFKGWIEEMERGERDEEIMNRREEYHKTKEEDSVKGGGVNNCYKNVG